MTVTADPAPQPESETDAIVLQYAELVKRIADHLLCRLPTSVDRSSLMQAGMRGLCEAATRYGSDHDVGFEMYAGNRIRGAMLDALIGPQCRASGGAWIDCASAHRAESIGRIARDESSEALVAAIDDLPERERLVMSLYYDEELNAGEIGAVLGATELQVRHLLEQAIARLRTRVHS